jgi:serine protease AprX
LRTDGGSSCGDARASGLWGARRGGRGSTEGRNKALRRGLLALLVLALAAPLAASAGSKQQVHGGRSSYLAPALSAAAATTPGAAVPVIVESADGPGKARDALHRLGVDAEQRLDIVDAAAGEVRAGDLPALARTPGLVITPDLPVVIDSAGGKRKGHRAKASYSSSEPWPAAVGVDQLWPSSRPGRRSDAPAAPTIAFVDSGIEADRPDFAGRVLADVDLTSLPGNSPGDGSGHGTLVAGLAAGGADGHTGAAPAAGIVSLDVMDDAGMARTSDVIAAAQWILRNRKQYDIRVANFSLHSATQTSFRWDPLDRAVEKLWFAGVVVVTAAGNYGKAGHGVRMAYAPGNDPFVLTVGALDLHNSTLPDRADAAPWSAWGYTFDGFAKPELSAPGRGLLGPVPDGSALATGRPSQVVRTSGGTYMRLSGTSLSAPVVSGIAAEILALHPGFTADQVKGALMASARRLGHAALPSAGVGEVYAPGAAALAFPPNPNRALDAFLVADPSGGSDSGRLFDDAAWLKAIKGSPSWDSLSWLDGWSGVAWSLVSWGDVSWSDVSWSDVSWSDVSWDDVSWSDASDDSVAGAG